MRFEETKFTMQDDDLGPVSFLGKDILSWSTDHSWAGPLRPQVTVELKDGTVYRQNHRPPVGQYPLIPHPI